MLTVLFALHRESSSFRQLYRRQRSFPSSPCWSWFCVRGERQVLVVETGMGQDNVVRALDWLLSKPLLDGVPYVSEGMLFAGYGGALREGLHVGDIVVAQEVVDTAGKSWPTTGFSLAYAKRERLLTTDRMVTSIEEKRRLGEAYQAAVVDMESAVFAERCTQAGMPFGCVRAISDDYNTPLSPELATLLSGGAISPWRVLALLARQPGIVKELWRLARDTRRASEALGVMLAEILARKSQ